VSGWGACGRLLWGDFLDTLTKVKATRGHGSWVPRVFRPVEYALRAYSHGPEGPWHQSEYTGFGNAFRKTLGPGFHRDDEY